MQIVNSKINKKNNNNNNKFKIHFIKKILNDYFSHFKIKKVKNINKIFL